MTPYIIHQTLTFFICFPFCYPPINPGLNNDLLKVIDNYTEKTCIVKFYETRCSPRTENGKRIIQDEVDNVG